MTKTRRAQIDADSANHEVAFVGGDLRVHVARVIGAETQGYPTGNPRAQSGTIEYDRGLREVGYETEMIIPGGCWLHPSYCGIIT